MILGILCFSPASSWLAESDSDPDITHEVDPDFLEHLRREAIQQPELLSEP